MKGSINIVLLILLSSYGVLARTTGAPVSVKDNFRGNLPGFSRVDTFMDGSHMTDKKCDGVIYIKAGQHYYRKIITGAVNVKWFGAKGDGITDDTRAIKKAMSFKMKCYIPAGTYIIRESLRQENDLYGEQDLSVFQFQTKNVDYLVVNDKGSSISNITIDGSKAYNPICGYWVDISSVYEANIKASGTVRNLYNANATKPCYGVMVYQASSSQVKKSRIDLKFNVSNIKATTNNIVGDVAGCATGIGTSINVSGVDHYVRIHDSNVNGVQPADDGDGIHCYAADYNQPNARGQYIIENCKVSNCAKRGIKVQAQHTRLSNCTVNTNLGRGKSSAVGGIDIYASNTSVINCSVVNPNSVPGGYGIRVDKASNITITGSKFNGLFVDSPLRLLDVNNFTISKSSFISSRKNPSNDYSVVFIQNSTGGTIKDCVIQNTQNSGSGIFFQSVTGDINVTGCTIIGNTPFKKAYSNDARIKMMNNK